MLSRSRENKPYRRNFRNCPDSLLFLWLENLRNISIESIRRRATLTIIVNIMVSVDNPDRDHFKRVSWHASIISADISALHGTTGNFYFLTSWFNFYAVLDFYTTFSNNFVIISLAIFVLNLMFGEMEIGGLCNWI